MVVVDPKNNLEVAVISPRPIPKKRGERRRPSVYLNNLKGKEIKPLILSNNRGDMSITLEEAKALRDELTKFITELETPKGE